MGMKLTTHFHLAQLLKEAMMQGRIEPDGPNPDVYDCDHVYIYLGWKNRLWFHHLLHRSYQIGNVPSWNVTVPYHNVHNHGKQVIHLGVNICKPVSLRGPSCKNHKIPPDLLVNWYSKSSFNTEVMFLKMAKYSKATQNEAFHPKINDHSAWEYNFWRFHQPLVRTTSFKGWAIWTESLATQICQH